MIVKLGLGLGLVLLVAAVVAGVAGVLTNSGHAHAVGHFAVFGYHVTGSTGTLFLYGIIVGAVAILGLSLLLAGARRTARRGRDARHGLAQSRRETAAVTQDRDNLAGQRDTARAYTASNLGDSAGNGSTGNSGTAGRLGAAGRLFGRQPAPRQPTQASGQQAAGVRATLQPAPMDASDAGVGAGDSPVSVPAPAE